jgi:hypothetical protein
MSDKVDPVEILLEKREDIKTSIGYAKSNIAGKEVALKNHKVELDTYTAQLVVIDAALTKLGYLIEEESKKK